MELNLKEIRPYKKGAGYSYTLGAFPTMELIKKKKERAAAVVGLRNFFINDSGSAHHDRGHIVFVALAGTGI